MKNTIRHILKEEVNRKLIAKNFLDQLELSPWENKRYGMEFLVTPKGTAIFLNTKNDKEFSVESAIYNQLKRILKDDQLVEIFVVEYAEDYGLNIPYGSWVVASENVGSIEEDDSPMTFDDENDQL